MTQVLQHNYGKSRITLPAIRAAIKAVKASKAGLDESGPDRTSKIEKRSVIRSRR